MIREAIFSRYSLVYYAYTNFKYGTLTGIPVMRPMLLEFPEEEELFKIGNQFMYGDKILVSPKISWFNEELNGWLINTVMPASTEWYEWNTRKLEVRSSPIV